MKYLFFTLRGIVLTPVALAWILVGWMSLGVFADPNGGVVLLCAVWGLGGDDDKKRRPS